MAINIPILSSLDTAGFDKAKKEFASLEGAGEKAGFAIKKAAVPAGLAIAALGAAAFDAAKGAMEDAAAQEQLARTLKTTTTASDDALKANENFISSLSIATATADDKLRPALAMLATGSGDLETAQQGLRLALDISAATGKDVGTVSEALSKAYAGNMKGLKELDPRMKEMIKDGIDAEGAMSVLSDTFGGDAVAAANTAEGQFKTFGIMLAETKETIGAALMPAIEAILPKLMAFGQWASEHTTVMMILGGVIGGIAIAVLAVNTAMKIWAAGQALVNGVVAIFNAVLAANPLVLVAGLIVILAAAAYLAYQKFDVVREVVDKVFDVFQKIGGYVSNTLLGVFGSVVDILQTMWDKFGIVRDVMKIVLGVFKDVGSFIIDKLLGAFDNIIVAAALVGSAFSNAFKGAATLIKGFINTIIKGWNGIQFKIPGFKLGPIGFDGFTLGLPQITPLAAGGIVNSPTLAMIGEAGPEAVVPLTGRNAANAGLGAGTTNITINVAGGDPNAIVAALQRYVRTIGPVPVNIRPM